MLTLTRDAVRVIRALTDEHGVTSEAGVRLCNDEAGTLIASLVQWPDDGDHVMEFSGARLFIDANVVRAVDDKSLDATITHDGEALFALNDPPDPAARRPAALPRRGRHRRRRRDPSARS